ncbi:MAG: DUF262 domain-containing protein, partial [Clostridia bacterium]
MSFQSISVREAIENINSDNNGWFLPYVQRQYVWGNRYESEKYLCRLFDSILKGYPIGTLLVWNTEKEIPYREFLTNYIDGATQNQVDKTLWTRKDKWLVYDGQQRLQTLFSCLKYTVNNRIITFNIQDAIKEAIKKTADEDKDVEQDEMVWFSFTEKNTIPNSYISIPELYSKKPDEKISFRNKIKNSLTRLTEREETEFETLFDNLWTSFVLKDKKSLAFFPMDNSMSEEQVNDVFQRINSGGVPLSGADLLLSKIKERSYDFEEKLITQSKEIETALGISIKPDIILQIMSLIIRNRVKLEPEKTKTTEIARFPQILPNVFTAIDSFFKLFIYDKFQINKNAIVQSWQSLFPLIIYIYNKLLKNKHFNDIVENDIIKMKQFFIYSQINDWRTVYLIENGCKEAMNATEHFPLKTLEDAALIKGRVTGVSVKSLERFKWFVLKVLTPQKCFSWVSLGTSRMTPELDHIFPKK